MPLLLLVTVLQVQLWRESQALLQKVVLRHELQCTWTLPKGHSSVLQLGLIARMICRRTELPARCHVAAFASLHVISHAVPPSPFPHGHDSLVSGFLLCGLTSVLHFAP
ncbi:hypothetical protein M758_6G034100 [Ceratodon purpureus]|nr:hypothetical protein M758_6G034100 [Ceratodon purpureus]